MQVSETLNKLNKTLFHIETTRTLFKPAAIRAANLFKLVNNLSLLQPTYQISLKSYFQTFDNFLMKHPGKMEFEESLKGIISMFTRHLYHRLTYSLLEKDKQVV